MHGCLPEMQIFVPPPFRTATHFRLLQDFASEIEETRTLYSIFDELASHSFLLAPNAKLQYLNQQPRITSLPFSLSAN
jgi:hypothetical protein